ncbi:MAG TPA: hypothetical protein PKD55_24345 [Bellilinea sp.]|nr:hypothetical protein [Bellilinea sp.]
MSKESPADCLRDLLGELDDIEAFVSKGRTVFFTDTKTRKAVIRSVEVVGEMDERLAAGQGARTVPGRHNTRL